MFSQTIEPTTMTAPPIPRLFLIEQRKQKDGDTWLLFGDKAKESNDIYYAKATANDTRLVGSWPWKWAFPPFLIDKRRVVPQYMPNMTVTHRDASYLSGCDEFDRYFHVKSPQYLLHGDRLVTGPPPVDIMSREIKTCEFLNKHPHPNVCAYHGVLLDSDSFAEGLVFDKYTMNLAQYVRRRYQFDAKDALDDIEAGIDHIHSLGLVHCDIKPENILVDVPNRRFVVGDFDSTHQRGERLAIKWGTPGWTNERFMEAHREVDFHGLSMIRNWLENKGFGEPMEGESYMATDQILARARNAEAVLKDASLMLP
jgi:serine/threonine protein kinase